MLHEPLHIGMALGAASLILEILTVLFRSKLIRRVLYGAMIVFTAPAAALILAGDLRLGTLLCAIVGIFRIINGLRVVLGRVKEVRLRPATKRTTLFLIMYQLAAVAVWRAALHMQISPSETIYAIAFVSLAASFVIAAATNRNLKRTKVRPGDKYAADSELPTVTVCIPARNETEDLPKCLASVLDSDYPKLEVIVLDDCSQDRTSEVIKDFAHKGVRFIKGKDPAAGWLAKNQAYQALAEDASGELLLFMGVDAGLERGTIRSLVGMMSARSKSMISILPRGRRVRGTDVLIQPLRYWWELALPRRLFNRPPVLSTAWMISRSALFRLGEFKAARGSVLPEGHFARALAKTDEYSFIRSSGKLVVTSGKKFREQWETAVRMRYPEAKQRPENVLAGALLQIWFIAFPLGVFILGFVTPLGWLWLIGGFNALVLFWVHYRIVRAWNSDQWALSVVMLPVSLVIEIADLLVSMMLYEFSRVVWKERNICIPVMNQYPKLPPA